MYAVIMAGGKGSRFWPRSRAALPKHLLDIVSEKTIIRETVDRVKPLIPVENVLVVTGAGHADELKRQLPDIPADNILIEPVGRNTAPCIGLAALHIRKRTSDDVMVVLPSDHKITDEPHFLDVLRAAAAMATQGDHLVTIGITPTGPETGYGYLEEGEVVRLLAGEKVYRVRSIREKPALEQARAFLRQGGFLWNSGMFIWKASTIIEAIGRWLPDLHRGLTEIDRSLGTDRQAEVINRVYQSLLGISVDYGIMEKADDVYLVRGDFGWSDMGSWDALWEVSLKDAAGNVVRGEAIMVDSKNSLVFSPDKLVALIGVEDLVVVETKDALLICRKGASQDVKKVVDILETRQLQEYL